MKQNLITKSRLGWRSHLVFLLILSTTGNHFVMADGDDLGVTITQESNRIVQDSSGTNYMIFGEDDTDLTFDCHVEGIPLGTFYFVWDFGGGEPPNDNLSPDSGAGPSDFSGPAIVTVNVDDYCPDGTLVQTCQSSIPVSQVLFSPDVYDATGDPDDGPIYSYIENGATVDADGKIKINIDITISTNSSIASGTLGSLACADHGTSSLVDDYGSPVTEAATDGDGEIRVTLRTLNTTENVTIEIN